MKIEAPPHDDGGAAFPISDHPGGGSDLGRYVSFFSIKIKGSAAVAPFLPNGRKG
jgi:hypothetical protein